MARVSDQGGGGQRAGLGVVPGFGAAMADQVGARLGSAEDLLPVIQRDGAVQNVVGQVVEHAPTIKRRLTLLKRKQHRMTLPSTPTVMSSIERRQPRSLPW